jgi:release factor-specific protein-(glutamine-N5) methyltransferase
MHTIGVILNQAANYLQEKGLENARLNAEIIIGTVLGLSRVELYLHFERPLSDGELSSVRDLIRRRLSGQPLQYLTGHAEFYSLTFRVGPAALIPRPETEILVEALLKRLPPQEELSLADVGTGCGNIVVTLAIHLPRARLWAIDSSTEALALAQENARAHGVEDRIGFLQGDLLTPLYRQQGTLAAVISNPPYVSTDQLEKLPAEIREHEPLAALDGGCDGLEVIRRLIPAAADMLSPQDHLGDKILPGRGDDLGLCRDSPRHSGAENRHSRNELSHSAGEFDMAGSKRLFLIDGHALAYRSYFAFIRNPLINTKGENTSAVFGFSSALLKIIREHKPDYLAVVFDTSKPTFRHRMYPKYKSTRAKMPDPMREQMPRIQQIVKAMNIPVLEREGYEADDIMASLARQAENLGMDVVLVTGDKDLLQLVTQKIKVLDPRRGGEDEVLYDEEGVRRRFGLKPEQIVDFMSLKGDASDNVPGVPGIGDKTAQKIIQEFGDLESALKAAEKMDNKRMRKGLREHADQARMSRKLVLLDDGLEMDIDFQQLILGDFDTPKLVELFRELEFTSLLRQISVEGPDHQLDCSLVATWKEFSGLVQALKKAGAFVLDVETTSTDPMQADLVGLSFAVRPGEAFYLPVGHVEGPNLDLDKVLTGLKPLLTDDRIAKCGHNIKYDRTVLVRHGCPLEGLAFDTMVASYLINPSARRHNLDLVSLEYLGGAGPGGSVQPGGDAPGQRSVGDGDGRREAGCGFPPADVGRHGEGAGRTHPGDLPDGRGGIQYQFSQTVKLHPVRETGAPRDPPYQDWLFHRRERP